MKRYRTLTTMRSIVAVFYLDADVVHSIYSAIKSYYRNPNYNVPGAVGIDYPEAYHEYNKFLAAIIEDTYSVIAEPQHLYVRTNGLSQYLLGTAGGDLPGILSSQVPFSFFNRGNYFSLNMHTPWEGHIQLILEDE